MGAGRRGRAAHLPALVHLRERVDFVAVCDADPEAAEAAANQAGVRAYTDLRTLLDRERLDAADVAVPADGHHAICCTLLAAGVACLVETPIAPTLALADAMIAAAERAGIPLEVAENYYRHPIERAKVAALRAGAIGRVTRLHRIFQEGGYHGMSLLRTYAGGNPIRVYGLTHETAVLPHTDRMRRHHDTERWTWGWIDFDNGVGAEMAYSNVIHARSLGRGAVGFTQIDGTEGTIVNATVYPATPEALAAGGRVEAIEPRIRQREVDGVRVTEAIALPLPSGEIVWENPWAHLPLTDGQVAVAQEIVSLVEALESGTPEYGAAAGRCDQEMNLAMLASAQANRVPIALPLQEPLALEREIHARMERDYGCDPFDAARMVSVFYPRR